MFARARFLVGAQFFATLLLTAGVPDLAVHRFGLGDYSSLLYTIFFQQTYPVEGFDHLGACYLEAALPTSARVSEWVHPAALVCPVEGTEHVLPLGNLAMRRAYQNKKWILRGNGAVLLLEALKGVANEADVQSPIASRFLDWGPGNELQIFTLRQSASAGNLKAGLECYEQLPQGDVSCALSNAN